ncbi:glycosyltransferase [Paenibacillus illinoisensis]|nr:glycosyltransferase [Paenibacillus illinoisensis]
MIKCSVLLPVYNGEAFLKEALDSVLAQDYRDFDVIIVDDCSSDSSRDIIIEYKDKYKEKINFIKNDKNSGVGLALLKAFKETNSTYIAQIGQDDIWSKDYLTSQIEYIERNNCNVVFSKVKYIDEKGNSIKDLTMFNHENIEALNRSEFFAELIGGNFLCAPSSVFKIGAETESVISQFWGYNNDRLQDFELWLNLACYYEFGYNKKAICKYRIHQNNFSKEEKRIVQGKYEFYATLKRVLFSEGFILFLNDEENREDFLKEIIIKIQLNIAYSKLLFMLLVEWCEYLLNLGFEVELIKIVMADYYNRMGLLSKCISNYGSLYHKIHAYVMRPFNNSNSQFLLNSELFECHSKLENIDANTICFIEASMLDYAMNNALLMKQWTKKRVVLFCQEEELSELKSKYRELLIISDEEPETQIERKIINYIEDKTDVFATGFFFDYDTLNNSINSQTYKKLKIRTTKGEQIRKVQFLDLSYDISCSFSMFGKEIEVLSNENNIYTLVSVPPEDIYISIEEGIELGQKIIVNNKLYILDDIEYNHGFVPVYTPFTYYSSNIYSKDTHYHRSSFLELEYHSIVNSRLYRYMIKLKSFVHKYKLLRFVNLIDSIFKRTVR